MFEATWALPVPLEPGGVCKFQTLIMILKEIFGQTHTPRLVDYFSGERSWPAMRVISLGIRTVPVLSVAKKLAAPRPTPTAPAAKCGLIKQDEAD